MIDDEIGEGSPNSDCCDDSSDAAGKPTRESILERLDQQLANSGGAYSAEKMPIDMAIQYSLIAARSECGKQLTSVIEILAQNVVGRVQYAEDTLQKLMRPQRTIIRSRIKRQESIINQLIGLLGNCVTARCSYVQAQLADIQSKMLAGEAATPSPQAQVPDTGTEYQPEESPSGPPSPAALGAVIPPKPGMQKSPGKECIYIDVCDRDGWWSWWYYWWYWVVWWWSWFRWYLRAWWVCQMRSCNMPAQPYTPEGMQYVIALEQQQQQSSLASAALSGTALATNQPLSPVPMSEMPGAPAGRAPNNSAYCSCTLYDYLATSEMQALIVLARQPDADKKLQDELGSKDQSLPDVIHQFLDHPVDLEHYLIETLPEE